MRHDIYPDNGLVSWSPVYRSITWINSFIKNAPLALELDENLTQAELSSMLGKARALRALNYFYLVSAFREVPLITEPYESDSQTFNTATASTEEVWDFVEENLEFALEHAPEYSDNENERYGSITKNALRTEGAAGKF